MPRRSTTPAPVEETPVETPPDSTDGVRVEPEAPEGRDQEINITGQIAPHESEYPPLTDEEYFRFKGFVLETLNNLEQRIQDVESTVAGVIVPEHARRAAEGVPEPSLADSGDDDDDDIPDFLAVAGVQRAFNGGEDDGVPFFRPPQ
jgi:hypothetical protein